MSRLPAWALVAAVLPSIGLAEPSAPCAAPAALDDGWRVSEPQAQQLDPAPLCALGPRLAALERARAHGVVVARRGAIVYEQYFTGPDGRWPQQHWRAPLEDTPHDPRTKHDLQSITKSVVALLAGVAIDRGLLRGVDAPVLPLFPELADLSTPARERITLRDLLTMRAGLDWPTRPYLAMARRVDAAQDPYRLIVSQPMTAEPGTRWRYNNGVGELAGGVVQKAVGRRLDDFARDVLFEPLGITDWEWGRMASGDPSASWGLRLSPRDLAKIGQLVLDEGVWQGRRIVSADWVREMIRPHVAGPTFAYAYLWWREGSPADGRGVERIRGTGWGGQCLEIVPSLALVVVVTAGAYDFDGRGPQNLACDAAMETVLRATVQR